MKFLVSFNFLASFAAATTSPAVIPEALLQSNVVVETNAPFKANAQFKTDLDKIFDLCFATPAFLKISVTMSQVGLHGIAPIHQMDWCCLS